MVSPALNLLQRDGRSVRLKPRTMDVLVYLANHAGEVVSTNDLISSVWQGRVVGDGTVYQSINQIRHALGDRSEKAAYIETIAKRGYRLTVPVSPMSPAGDEESDLTTDGRAPKWKFIFASVAILAVALALLVDFKTDERQPGVLRNSVAVLPFENLSPDPDDAYFAVGIHEEILNQLAKLSGLNVIARTSVGQYANTDKSILQIAEELNVETVMEGSVRYAGDSILVTAQLIDPETNSHLWSETYPGDLSDLSTLFAMQADIAMNIANALEAEFSIREQEDVERRPTASAAAYEYYLRALAAPSGPAPFAFFDQAIEADPDFALAYALRATRRNFVLMGVAGTRPGHAAELERLVQNDAERAVSLDPNLGLAHAALAVPHFVNWRGAEAEQEFQRAMELAPNNVDVLILYGRFKRFRGEYGAAIGLTKRALELDPNNVSALNQSALHYRQSGDLKAAADVFSVILARGTVEPGAYVGSGIVEALLGRQEEAVRLFRVAEQVDLDAFRLPQLAHGYSLAGQHDHARRLFAQFEREASDNPVGAAGWIRAYIAVGDYEQARQRLESALQSRTPADFLTLTMISDNAWNDPELDKPEFRELLDGLWRDR